MLSMTKKCTFPLPLRVVLAALAAAVVVMGCQSYQAKPLDSAAVERTLAFPDSAALRVQVSEFHHPILQPITIDLADGLSPDEAAVLAVLTNPSLRAIRDRRAIARAQLLQAGLLPNPQLASSLEVPTGGDTQGTVTALDLGVDWDVTALVTLSTRQDEEEAALAGVELDIAWQEWQTAQAAKSGVYRLKGLNAQVDLAIELDEQMTENADRVGQAVTRGLRTRLDAVAAESAANKAHARLLEVEMQAAQQRLELAQLLGLEQGADLRLQDDVRLPSQWSPPSESEIVDGLEQRRLDLVALRRGYESQEAAVRKAILEQFPRIRIGPTAGRDTDNVEKVGFAVSIELPIFDRNQAGIALEQATRQKLFDEYAARVLAARSDITVLLGNAQFLNRRIAAAKAAESGLRKLVTGYRAAVEEGRADFLWYTDAMNDLASQQLETLRLQQQLAETRAALELASGLYSLDRAGEAPASMPTTQGGKE